LQDFYASTSAWVRIALGASVSFLLQHNLNAVGFNYSLPEEPEMFALYNIFEFHSRELRVFKFINIYESWCYTQNQIEYFLST
jgi:hypothetical protein